MISNFTARRGDDGRLVFSFPALVAPYAGTMTAVYAWYPDGFRSQIGQSAISSPPGDGIHLLAVIDMVEAAGVELFSVLTARKLLILRMARGAKKAPLPIPLYVNWIAADIVRIENGFLAEHWDVLQDEATEEQSKSKAPMFGTSFPK